MIPFMVLWSGSKPMDFPFFTSPGEQKRVPLRHDYLTAGSAFFQEQVIEILIVQWSGDDRKRDAHEPAYTRQDLPVAYMRGHKDAPF